MAFEIKNIINDALTIHIDKLWADGKTENEIKQILESKNFIETGTDALCKMVSLAVTHLQNDMSKEMEYINSANHEFYNNNINKWGEAFDYYEALYFILIEASEIYTEGLKMLGNETIKEKQYLYEVLRALHGKGLQIYAEVLCLMKNGFADGAFARWRSIYELEVVARFIAMHGEKVAESYFNHVLDDNHYAWASDCFKSLIEKGKRITFGNLEEKCKFYKNNWEQKYGLASKIIHPSPSGVFGRLSNQKDCSQNHIIGSVVEYV